jgi:hypothetical protein
MSKYKEMFHLPCSQTHFQIWLLTVRKDVKVSPPGQRCFHPFRVISLKAFEASGMAQDLASESSVPIDKQWIHQRQEAWPIAVLCTQVFVSLV